MEQATVANVGVGPQRVHGCQRTPRPARLVLVSPSANFVFGSFHDQVQTLFTMFDANRSNAIEKEDLIQMVPHPLT
jgi:hypothetical protein